jgi:hypothetical protein
MRKYDIYTNTVLTIIAGLLAWIAAAKLEYRSVHAQAASRPYAVEVVIVNFGTHTFQADLAAGINSAAKGRELVTVVNHDQPGKYLAIYK